MEGPKIPAQTRRSSRASGSMTDDRSEQKVGDAPPSKNQKRVHNTRGKKPKAQEKEEAREEVAEHVSYISFKG